MSPLDSAPAHDRLEARLRQLRRRRRRLAVGAAALTGITVGAVAGGALVALEALLYLAPPWRGGLLALAAGAALWPAARLLLRRLRCGPLSLHTVTLDVEARAPELSQRLLTALELGAPGRPERTHSADLLAAATSEADRILADLPAAQLAPATGLRHVAGRCVLALGAGAILLAADPARDAVFRVLHPTVAYTPPQRTHLRVHPGDLEVIRGDDAVFVTRLHGRVPQTVRVARQDVGAAEAVVEEIVLVPDFAAGDSLVHRFTDVRRAFDYRLRAGDAGAGPFRVRVIDPPEVTRLRLAYEYPAYSGLAPRVDEESGDISALAGTRVTLHVTASKPLSAAQVVVDDTLRLPAQVVDDGARVDWTLPALRDSADSGTHHYRIRLTDRKDVGNRDPIRYAVQILRDGRPAVSVPVPGADGDLPESQRLDLEVEAADDYGLSRLDLVFRVNDGPEERRRLAADAGRRARLRYAWDLSDRDLLPEDRVRFHAEAFDNDAVAGPKRARSREYVLRLPSIYELFDEASQQQEERVTDLKEIADEGERAREVVEQLRRDVLRTEELTWEQRQELAATLDAEEERARQAEQLARQMSSTMEKLEAGGTDTGELLEKMEQIRELMGAVASPEMLEALRELQEKMADPATDPRELAEALERFAEDQQAFQERIDRTLELLRQVHAEQQLAAATTQAADLEKRQQQINESLDRGAADRRLREQESSLARDTDRLREQLESLSDSFDELHSPTAEALAEQAQTMAQQELSGRMRRMEQELASQTTQARSTGAGLQEDLGRLSQALQGLQQEFSSSQREQMSGQLRGAMAGLVDLSRAQEDLARRAGRVRGEDAAELARQQQALARGVELVVEEIARVSRRSLAVESGLAATIGQALRQMEAAGRHLGQLQASRAAEVGAGAVGRLNEAVLQLRQSVDNLSQAKMPSAFGEAMEKMMGLSQQQADLNQATQQALQSGSQPGPQGGRGDGLSALPRLAAEQRRIHRALGELERSLRGQRSMQDRVEHIRQEMESVLARMQRGQPDPLVEQGQQRILQRMLDASRSIHDRGFEKQRRGEAGQQQPYAGPEWLPADLGQQPDRLAEAMRRALAGDYPAQYKQLIRRYYETVYRDVYGEGDGPADLAPADLEPAADAQ